MTLRKRPSIRVLYTAPVRGSPANRNCLRNRKCRAFLRSEAFSAPTDRSMSSNSLSMCSAPEWRARAADDEVGTAQPLAVVWWGAGREFHLERGGNLRRDVTGQRKPAR